MTHLTLQKWIEEGEVINEQKGLQCLQPLSKKAHCWMALRLCGRGGGRGLEMCVTNLLSGATSMPCFWESEARRLREEQREEDREREEDEESRRERSEMEETRFRRRERRGSLAEGAQLPPEELPVTSGDMFLGVMLPDEYHF